jgi:ADP-ribosylglycohydrolase
LAIFDVRQADKLGFASMLEQIIAVGGDTDSNASIAGQLVGVRLGSNGLPADLIRRLCMRFSM